MEDLNLPAQYDAEPHPYLHEPLLYISNIPSYVTDDEIALVFQPCAKFRIKIARDGSPNPLSGTIEFQFLDRGLFAI
jgi:polyadenylate-binding protein